MLKCFHMASAGLESYPTDTSEPSLFLMFIYLFCEREHVGEGERERERESQAGSTLSTKPDTELDLPTVTS